MILMETPNNPTLIYALIALGTVGITKLVDYFLKKSDNNSKVKIAELNISQKEYENLKINLKNALESIKKLKETLDTKDEQWRMVLEKKDNELSEIKGDWKAVRVAFQILFKGYERIFIDDSDSLSMLSEMMEILNKKIR